MGATPLIDTRLRDCHAGAETACLYAFDILMLDGHDTRSAPLIERKPRGWRLC